MSEQGLDSSWLGCEACGEDTEPPWFRCGDEDSFWNGERRRTPCQGWASARRWEYDLHWTGALNKNKAPEHRRINIHDVKINLSSIYVLDCNTQLQGFNLRLKHPPLEEPHSTQKTLRNPNNYITTMPLQCTILKHNTINKYTQHNRIFFFDFF